MKLLLVAVFLPFALCKKETVELKGKFTCPSDSSKASGIKVKLLDKKLGEFLHAWF